MLAELPHPSALLTRPGTMMHILLTRSNGPQEIRDFMSNGPSRQLALGIRPGTMGHVTLSGSNRPPAMLPRPGTIRHLMLIGSNPPPSILPRPGTIG